ncbi:MAG: hypothetical protein ACYTG0_02110, partial [Planctomycetota bacterium]
MSMPRFLPVLIVLSISMTQTSGGEPAKTDRTVKTDRSIGKEPEYQSEKPEYSLLAFGPKAKTRVWVVRDGDIVYVDRNGDGDLTAADERVPLEHGSLREALPLSVGKPPIQILSLETREGGGYYVKAEVEGKRLQYGSVRRAGPREEAPMIHFDGPLVMGLAHTDPSKQPLQRGSKP